MLVEQYPQAWGWDVRPVTEQAWQNVGLDDAVDSAHRPIPPEGHEVRRLGWPAALAVWVEVDTVVGDELAEGVCAAATGAF
jgi:hypothetical protein